MKIRAFSKILTVVAILAMVLSFASCGLFGGGGALELVSFTVDRTSVKTNYLIGEEIDFSGIKATVKYTDESLNTVYTYDDLTISYADDITATVGEKDVLVSFDDPHLGVKQETTVKIKVTEEPVEDNTDPLIVTQLEQPSSITAFNSANKNAGSSQYGSTSFAGEFAVGGATYVVGNENVYKLNPLFSVLGDDGLVKELAKFYAVVEISVEKDGEYVVLTKTAGEGNLVSYYDGEILIATVDTYEGEYHFSTDAEGLKVKIAVLPSEDYYIYDGNAVVLEARVIKAFNVYEAAQLAVIDNFNDEWNEIKTANGLANIVASGIVLHDDIMLTAEDVPASFFLTSTKDVVYTNSITNETLTIPAGTKFLKDWTNVFHRVGADDFVINGNLFTIDVSSFPLIASPAVFGLDGTEDDYGSDFSNSTLFKLDTTQSSDMAKPDDVSVVEISNIALIGNTGRDNLVDADGNLASAGGLILMKSSYFTDVTVNNAINNCFFITYLSDTKATIEANNVKCYDSYQNAAMAWGEAAVHFVDSYLNGSGGPIVIATSVYADNLHPSITLSNTITETHLEGSEIWFSALNATAAVSQMKALSAGISGAGLGSFVDSTGKMNIMGLLMAEGFSADAVIGGIGAQGVLTTDNGGMNRFIDQATWGTIYQHSQYIYSAYGTFPAYLTVYDAAGTAYTVWSDGTNLFDLAGNQFGTDASHQAIAAAFVGAKTVTLSQGGMSILFELYH